MIREFLVIKAGRVLCGHDNRINPRATDLPDIRTQCANEHGIVCMLPLTLLQSSERKIMAFVQAFIPLGEQQEDADAIDSIPTRDKVGWFIPINAHNS